MAQIIKEGYITINEEITNEFVKKWFKLSIIDDLPVIQIYNTQKSAKADPTSIFRIIHLTGCVISDQTEVMNAESPSTAKYCLEINTPYQPYLLFFDDVFEYQDWKKILETTISRYDKIQADYKDTVEYNIRVIGSSFQMCKEIIDALNSLPDILSVKYNSQIKAFTAECKPTICSSHILAFLEDLGHAAYFV